MNIIDIISKKRDSKELNKLEIEYFVREYTNNNITDYQAAALIMAIYINGMNEEEITNLTLAMCDSGEKLDLSTLGENVVDKHSTGGVGDKVTIILMPIIAAMGIPVAKMSGRGLGFTGGTIDKLHSIPGYNTDIEIEEFINNVKKIGISVIGQTLNLAPADKKIYALRDAIACTKSIPLIASSVMSKKIASGANKIVLDITVGSGAFMKNKKEALSLARCMNKIGKLANKETVCILTSMEEPLGYAVGNSLEIKEAIEYLKGNTPKDVKEVVETIGAYMIKLAGKGENLEANKVLIEECVRSGKAYSKFVELVENQGGDIEYIKGTKEFEKAKFIIPVFAEESGYITKVDAERIGSVSVYIGAGRMKKEDEIDYSVGIILNKKVGDNVQVGEPIAYLHANDEAKVKGAVENIKQAYQISHKKPEKTVNIIDIIK